MNTHLSPGRSLERKLHCTGCEGPGGVRHGQNRTLNLRHESYRGSLTQAHRDRRRRRERRRGRSRGCRARARGRGRACQGGWRQWWKDWRRMGKVRFGVRRWRDYQPHPLSCYCDCPHHRLTRTPLKHTYKQICTLNMQTYRCTNKTKNN